MMPGINGLELSRRLRAVDPAVRIIVVTGGTMDLEPGLAASGIEFLSKPFTRQMLAERLPPATVKPR